MPERHQLEMHPVLQSRPVADQMQPQAGPLTLSAPSGRGQPDRRHQIAARQLGEHPRVDPVGLARKRRQALDLLRVGDLDLPAAALERVVHKPGAVHRLDRRPHRPETQLDDPREPAQPIRIRAYGGRLDRRPGLGSSKQ